MSCAILFVSAALTALGLGEAVLPLCIEAADTFFHDDTTNCLSLPCSIVATIATTFIVSTRLNAQGVVDAIDGTTNCWALDSVQEAGTYNDVTRWTVSAHRFLNWPTAEKNALSAASAT